MSRSDRIIARRNSGGESRRDRQCNAPGRSDPNERRSLLPGGPRVEQSYVEMLKIADVASYDREIVANCDSSDLGVSQRRRQARTVAVAHNLSPNSGSGAIERQHAPLKLFGKIDRNPALETLSSHPVAGFPRTANQLTQGLRGQVQISCRLCFEPVEHQLFRPRFDRLADNVCIEQVSHQSRSTSRPADRSRSICSSTPTRGDARKKATSSRPVVAFGTVNIGSSVSRMRRASSPPARSAPAMALTRPASPDGTVTSTRLEPPASTLLRCRATRGTFRAGLTARFIATSKIR